MKTALGTAPVDPVQIQRVLEATKEWHLMFLRSPNKFFAKKNSNRVCLIQFGINRLEEVRCRVAKYISSPTAKCDRFCCQTVHKMPNFLTRCLLKLPSLSYLAVKKPFNNPVVQCLCIRFCFFSQSFFWFI